MYSEKTYTNLKIPKYIPNSRFGFKPKLKP